MKILLFTPAMLASAIGRVSNLVIVELSQQGHEVVVVRTEDPALFEEPTRLFPCQMVPWSNTEQVRQLADESALIVYQVGNHYAYHRGGIEWLTTLPGIVCLHDNFLGHLFWSWSDRIGRPQALELLTKLYGPDVAHRFFDHGSSESFIAYAGQAAPMTEWITSMATGVIVHSSWAMDRITRACPGPVAVVPLPYDAPFLEVGELKVQPANNQELIVLTIGHVNSNKRYASVIEAIGASPLLRQRMSFRIVGAVDPSVEQELSALADSLNVKVAITGAVDDRKLADEIHHADIMSCLRWPALEAASASTIESMLYGKPTVVTNTGFYRDLPDDCVLKISPDAELNDLRAALERLVLSQQERTALGERACQYAVRTFRADNYAQHIVSMKRQVDRSRIVSAVANVFSNTLKRWGAKGGPVILEAIASPLELIR